MIEVSVISPAFNEKENIFPLFNYFKEFCKKNNLQNWELILIDDGSNDGTFEQAIEWIKKNKFDKIKVIKHKKNLGKTHAILSGVKEAQGKIIVIYDADMQYTLEDAFKLVKKLKEENLDIVAGWKQGKYEKKFVSYIYNWLSRKLFKIPIHDMNAMKALKKEVFDKITLRKDWHRYIIPLAYEKGFKIGEEKVILKPRKYGKAKYSSPFRILIGFFDLLAVKFQEKTFTFLWHNGTFKHICWNYNRNHLLLSEIFQTYWLSSFTLSCNTFNNFGSYSNLYGIYW